MTRYCQYHCRRCGSHFTSLAAFDAHHSGESGALDPCTFPEGSGLREVEGVCQISNFDGKGYAIRKTGVTLFEIGTDVDRQRYEGKGLRTRGRA